MFWMMSMSAFFQAGIVFGQSPLVLGVIYPSQTPHKVDIANVRHPECSGELTFST
jgi:hypothetical protein